MHIKVMSVCNKISRDNSLTNFIFFSIAYNFLTKMENGEVWPGVWTPKTYVTKASAIKVLFPNIPISLNYVEETLPPPQVRV